MFGSEWSVNSSSCCDEKKQEFTDQNCPRMAIGTVPERLRLVLKDGQSNVLDETRPASRSVPINDAAIVSAIIATKRFQTRVMVMRCWDCTDRAL